MTDLSTNVYEAAWSTDGKQILTGDITAGQASGWLFDATVVATKTAARLIKPDFPEPFHIEAWSPDMKTVAGAIIGPDGSGRAVAVMDLQTTKVRRFDVPVLPGQDFRIVTGWLPDSRRFLAATPGGLAIVDAVTGKWTTIDAPPGGSRYRLSADSRTLMVEREIYDGDVWLLELKQ